VDWVVFLAQGQAGESAMAVIVKMALGMDNHSYLSYGQVGGKVLGYGDGFGMGFGEAGGEGDG
jgi:hypothetical protein